MSADEQAPARLRRADSFLGVHFDFHAGEDCVEIGRDVTHRMVDAIIDAVRPDYVQCDCKGHSGLSSYPTRVGNPAPGFVKDQLRIWREATARRGVALYVHYSGVWDAEAVGRNPGWARVAADGKPDAKITSVFGPYVRELMIPQLIELADEYGVDGVWVDGDCWAVQPDYSPAALAAFREATKIEPAPCGPEAAHFFEFLEFAREGFREYLRAWVDALHERAPGLQVASNWAFSTMMPEPVTAAVDFLSGDYSPADSVNTARLEARYFAQQGRPWDLMAWGFSHRWSEGKTASSIKTAVQLMQEAAVVLSAGGGFQVYFQQKRDGSISLWPMEVMAEVARFCRDRQEICHDARPKPVPQVALVLSGPAHYRKSRAVFNTGDGTLVPLAGVLNCLLDSQLSVEVAGEHHLAGRMGEYPLVVLPEWEYLAPGFKDELEGYARAGGSLLVIGPRAADLFAEELGVEFAGDEEDGAAYLAHAGAMAGLVTRFRVAGLPGGAEPFGALHRENDMASPSTPAASVARLGDGMIAGVYLDLGERYRRARTALVRRFLGDLVRRLFPAPAVEVAGSRYVDVALNRIGGLPAGRHGADGEMLALNLVNTAGPHHDANVHTFDEIPPVGPLDVLLRTGRPPRRVTLLPGGKPLEFTFAEGAARLTVPRLDIHAVVLVEQAGA